MAMSCLACDEIAVVQWNRRVDSDTVEARYSCLTHTISAELAMHTHAAECQAPNGACNCTPEPLPAPDIIYDSVTTSTGWTVPAGTQGA